MAETPSSDLPEPRKPAALRKPRAARPAEAGLDEPAKAKFAKAIEEAKAGAEALRGEARARAGVYREQLGSKSEELVGEARALGDQAKEKATELAYEGKARATSALVGLGQIVEENAPVIDEKLGPKYGDYARQAARAMNDTAAKIEAKDLDELGEDAKEFVRKSPGLAIGMAAVAGFMLSRLFKKSKD